MYSTKRRYSRLSTRVTVGLHLVIVALVCVLTLGLAYFFGGG